MGVIFFQYNGNTSDARREGIFRFNCRSASGSSGQNPQPRLEWPYSDRIRQLKQILVWRNQSIRTQMWRPRRPTHGTGDWLEGWRRQGGRSRRRWAVDLGLTQPSSRRGDGAPGAGELPISPVSGGRVRAKQEEDYRNINDREMKKGHFDGICSAAARILLIIFIAVRN